MELEKNHEISVLEMGMSNLGEIHRLADVAKPDVAIITNIGVSHLEYLKTRENILKAKLEITDFFDSTNVLIINNDNDLLKALEEVKYKILRISTEQSNADFKADNIVLREEGIRFKVLEKTAGISPEFNIPIPGNHNVLNSLLAIACGRQLGLTYEDMISGISSLEFTSMRLDIVKGSKFTIIDDCYNASPDSMKAALEVLENASGTRRIAVLGTMKELGEEAYRLHREVGEYASSRNVDLLIVIGEFNQAYKEGFNKDKGFIHFQSNEEASKYLNSILQYDDVVLVKASRSMKFETIVKELKLINC
jgi:UDP-N-acetylmuramoyl-tripeptide--D-alanyl-D-alanine ligase